MQTGVHVVWRLSKRRMRCNMHVAAHAEHREGSEGGATRCVRQQPQSNCCWVELGLSGRMNDLAVPLDTRSNKPCEASPVYLKV